MPSAADAKSDFIVSLSQIAIDRTDRSPEDDFKTWAQCIVVTRGRQSNKFWYASDADANLGKTSVSATQLEVVFA